MTGDGDERGDEREASAKPVRQAGFLRTMRAVLWSFLGVRRRDGYEQDAAELNPLHVIIAGIIAAAVFVVVLLLVVRAVVS